MLTKTYSSTYEAVGVVNTTNECRRSSDYYFTATENDGDEGMPGHVRCKLRSGTTIISGHNLKLASSGRH